MGSELTDVMPGAEETYLSGKKRAGGEENGTREAPAPEKLEKEQWPGEGPGQAFIGRCYELVFVPLTSVPKEKIGGSHLRDYFCQLH